MDWRDQDYAPLYGVGFDTLGNVSMIWSEVENGRRKSADTGDGGGTPSGGGAGACRAMARERTMKYPERVEIVEVGPRDGLQLEAFVPTERKLELINALSQTGLSRIEATTFAPPKAVPPFRDAAEVMAGIMRNPAVEYMALVPNAVGAQRALATNVD